MLKSKAKVFKSSFLHFLTLVSIGAFLVFFYALYISSIRFMNSISHNIVSYYVIAVKKSSTVPNLTSMQLSGVLLMGYVKSLKAKPKILIPLRAKQVGR